MPCGGVVVMQSLPTRRTQQLPHAGESLALGFMGGSGGVNFEEVAAAALFFAPPDASRSTIENYGALHWTTAWPRLRDKLGEDDDAATGR